VNCAVDRHADEEIAATRAFLCSDDAGYIIGQTIAVNRGYYM
jgi:hypothetical protein